MFDFIMKLRLKMKFLILVLFIEILIIINSAKPIDFATFCNEVQRNLTFRYAIRVKQTVNTPADDAVFFFTDDTVFKVPALTNAVVATEKLKYVLHEILFNEPQMKPLKDSRNQGFWDQSYEAPNEEYNTAFCDWKTPNTSFWLMGDKYREYSIDVPGFKVSVKRDVTNSSKSKFGFMKNEKIIEMGFENIIGVVFAFTWSPHLPFSPIQVYVKGDRSNKMSSFQFDNPEDVKVKFEHGYTNFNYQLDSAVYLSPGRSLGGLPLGQQINHYFDIRTYDGGFSLFDFSYNQDNLFSGTNEELLGCAPSFCQTHHFDAIVRFPNGIQKLIYREFSWDFMKPFERIEYKTFLKTNIISRKKWTINFDFAIRNIIDGSFIHNQVLYIFRNGSFIETNDNFEILNDVRNAKNFSADFKDIANNFNGVPSQFYNALFYHKQTSIAYFILDDMYWAYSMVDKSLSPKGEQYPKLIQELGLPSKFRVKATYVEENENHQQIAFYFFGKNRFLTYNATLFNEETQRFEKGSEEYRCTSEFLGCPDNNYFQCPPDHENSDDYNKRNLILIILIAVLVIAILVILILAIVLYICLIKNKTSEQKNEEPVSATSATSATSTTDATSRGASEIQDNTSTISRRSQRVMN